MAEIESLPAAEKLSLPLPLYASVLIGKLTGRDGDRFSGFVGLNKEMVGLLKEKSRDESDKEIQQNTSDRMRFGEGSYEAWYSKNRTPFALINDAGGALAALVWFGPKPLGRKSLKHLSKEERVQDERTMDSGDWHTIVYRSYVPFRGKGIMTPFTRFAMDSYCRAFPQAKLWAGVYANNPASVGLATRLGFKILEEHSDGDSHETIMVQ
jgi:hypothetical protein